LAARSSPGASAKLSPKHKAMIPDLLADTPQAYGFFTNLWIRYQNKKKP